MEHLPCLNSCLHDAGVSGNLRLTHFKIAQRPYYVPRQQESLDLVSLLLAVCTSLKVLPTNSLQRN